MFTTITPAMLTGFAKQYSASAFKPYWKNPAGQTFYALLASFGFDGACLAPFKTTGGYINLHVTYSTPTVKTIAPTLEAQVIAARAENKALKANAVKRTVKTAPVKVKATRKVGMSLADLNILADLIAARR